MILSSTKNSSCVWKSPVIDFVALTRPLTFVTMPLIPLTGNFVLTMLNFSLSYILVIIKHDWLALSNKAQELFDLPRSRIRRIRAVDSKINDEFMECVATSPLPCAPPDATCLERGLPVKTLLPAT